MPWLTTDGSGFKAPQGKFELGANFRLSSLTVVGFQEMDWGKYIQTQCGDNLRNPSNFYCSERRQPKWQITYSPLAGFKPQR